MANIMSAIAVLRPGINRGPKSGLAAPATIDDVRWEEPLPQNFVPPTQAEVDAEIVRQSTPIDQADLDKWDRKLKALAITLKPAGMTTAQFKAAIRANYDNLG